MNHKKIVPIVFAIFLLTFSSVAFLGVSAAKSEVSTSDSPTTVITTVSANGLVSISEVNVGNQISSNGSVKVLASGQDLAQPIALSGGYVYWYNTGSGQLNRVSDNGGKVDTITTFNLSEGSVYGFVVMGNYVYTTVGALVQKTNIATGATTVIENGGMNVENFGLAVSNKYVFFIKNIDVPRSYNIERMSLTGSDLTTLATDPSPIPFQVLYSGGYVYWYDLYTGQIGKVYQDGGSAILLSPAFHPASTSGYIGIEPLTVVGTHVFWTYNFDIGGVWNNSVFAVTTSGANFKVLASTLSSFYGGVAAYKSSVLFANSRSEKLMSVPSTGGTATVLASGYRFRGLAVLGTSVYSSALDDIVSTKA